MAWSDPKTWTADDLLTASDLNQYVSDNLSALYALVQGGGRKNLLHNGAFQVHQRGTSTASITTDGYYTADRWNAGVSNLGAWTQSVESDAPTGSGFRKSLKMLCTTADASPAAGDVLLVQQKIEGQNLQSVRKGTASAEPLTLSFWTKSNKTGVYVVELQDVDNSNRIVAATYTVASSGTWEQQTITFPADATGAFDNDAEGSLQVNFWLAAGSNFTSGTLATVWQAYNAANRAVGQTNLAANTNNYWQVTGVQLETGSAATGFEFKGYETELAECQRYFQKSYNPDVAPGTSTVAGAVGYLMYDTTYQFDYMGITVTYPTTMRTTPTTVSIYATDGTANALSISLDTPDAAGGTPNLRISGARGFLVFNAAPSGTLTNLVCHYAATADL